jgi:hypothetical protein
MDNHAGKIAVIAWLAGLTDGDGCIRINKQPNNGNGQMVPEFTISTTCDLTYRHLSFIFNEIGVGCHWTHRKVDNPNWKDRWVISVCGMKRCKVLLEMLTPYLITKGEEAKLMLKFIDERFSFPMRRGYTPEQLAIADKLKSIKLNRNGTTTAKSSETIRQTPKGDDRVQPCVRAQERVRNG